MTAKKPKKKVSLTRTEEFVDDPQGEPETVREVESLDESNLRQIVDRFGPGAVELKISKVTPQGNEFRYAGAADGIDETYIQQNFGGGKYILKFFLNGEPQHTIPLLIGDPPKSAGLSNGSVVAGGNIEYRMLQDQISFLKDLVLKQGSGAGGGSTLADFTAAMSALHTIKGESSLGSTLDVVKSLLEIAKDVGGQGADWKTELLHVAKDALPLFGGMMQQKPNASGALPQGATMPVNADQLLKSAIVYLKKKCLAGVPPEFFVDLVMVNADDETYQALLQRTLASDFASFAQLDAEIGREPYIAWFKELYDGLRFAVQGKDHMDADTGRPGGDTANSRSNGVAGKGRSKAS